MLASVNCLRLLIILGILQVLRARETICGSQRPEQIFRLLNEAHYFTDVAHRPAIQAQGNESVLGCARHLGNRNIELPTAHR